MSGVLFYVQHLLGIGHLRRAAAIAKAIQDAGVKITMVSGGEPLDEIGFGDVPVVQLPPCRTGDLGFKSLVDMNGNEVTDDWYDNRRDQLLALFDELNPDMILLEMFPFGRRKFRFELLPLLELAKERGCLRYTSLREILVRKHDRSKEVWMIDAARDLMNHVVVHGDERVCRLEDSFPEALRVSDMLTHTGYVGPQALEGEREVEEYVTVSAGSGAVGEIVFRTALKARSLTKYKGHHWRFFCGPNLPEAVYQDLKAKEDEKLTVVRFDPDFPKILRKAALSISLSGYNTFMEVLAARVPAVVMPFDDGEESEQRERAKLFAKKGLVQFIESHELTVESLAAAADRATTYAPGTVSLEGAKRTAEVIKAAIAEKNKG